MRTKSRKTGPRESASTLSINSNANNNLTDETESKEPCQCLGPGCVNETIENSKYCSYECGMKLAKNRLVYFLKERFGTRFDKLEAYSAADKLNLEELNKINAEMETLRKKLTELEQRHINLDRVIERAKFAHINPNIEV